MKKLMTFSIAVISLLMLASYVCAQPGGNAGGAPPAGPMGGMQGRGMMNVEAVNAAISEIEAQVSALKAAMEGAENVTFGPPAGGAQGAQPQAGQADMQAAMAEMQKRQEAVQAAANNISGQLLILNSSNLQADITRMQEISRKAAEEGAKETAEMIQALIREKTEAAQALGVRIRTGGPGGPGGMGNQKPALESGFEWID